jgi:aminoglycoside phosphotransferase (APT) family kinase protein
MTGEDLAALSGYLSSRLGPTTVSRATQAFPGHSRATWMLDTEEHGGLVLRVDHPGGPLVPMPLSVEYAVYEKLWGSLIPVAEPLFYAEGTDWAEGRAHMVRRLVDGSSRVPGLTGTASDDPELRRAVCYEMAERLAEVHRLDWAALGFGEVLFVPTSPDTALVEEVQRWRGLWLKSRSDPFPLLLEATYWLEENVPDAPTRLCLNKGNNGLGEEIWRDGRIVALSDWELASIGDPSLDWAFSQGLLALHDPSDTLAHYAEAAGFDIAPALLAWAVVWIQVKSSMTTNGGIAAFLRGADNRMVRPALGLGHIKRTEAWLGPALGRDVTEVGTELLSVVRNSYLER